MCASREQCISDIKSKIEKWGLISGNEVQKIADQLVREGFIDEQRFAGAYANDKLHYNKWGRIKIAYNLRMKRISEAIIAEAVNNLDEEEYRETALKIVVSLLKARKGEDPRSRNARILRSMQGRGFEYELTRDLLRSDI
ncbi:MAG: regulatory protein RecX [Bacteroidales bacterium]|nr:regulatory protein RecX [Bacteroidales bacterium]